MKEKIIKQHDQRDCGAACLAMIARYHGLKMPLAKFRELTKTERTGTNIYGIIDGARQIGLAAEGLSGSQQEMAQAFQSGEVQFPLIAHTINANAQSHFLVVFSCEKGQIIIGDPDRGKQRLSLKDFLTLATGYIITFEITEQFYTGTIPNNSFIKLPLLLKGQYKKLVAILLISLFVAAIGVAGAFVFEIAIGNIYSETTTTDSPEEDHYHEHDEHDHEGDDATSNPTPMPVNELLDSLMDYVSKKGLSVIFIGLIALYLFRALITFIRGYLVATISRTIDTRLSLGYFNHIVDLPMPSIGILQTGDYLSRFSDTYTIREAVSEATITLVLDTLMAVACGFLLYMMEWKLFLISLGIVVLYSVIVLCFKKPIATSSRTMMEKDAQVQSYFKESLDGIETVKAFNADDEIKRKTTSKFNLFINSVFRTNLIFISQETVISAVEMIGIVCILWLGFLLVLKRQISVGMLITFYALLAYFTEPIKNLINLQPTIQRAFVAIDRLNDILTLQKEECEESGVHLEAIQTIQFNNVDFRYSNRELTLENINLSIFKGDKLAVVGQNGSGKSTLAKLLIRFYKQESGDIIINGESIEQYTPKELRSKIAYIDHQPFLFSDTIKNNIRFGSENANDEAIEHVCKQVMMTEFLDEQPFGLDTPIEEGGTNISGGQRQRIALARALLKQPEVLILDEATSNLDAIAEEQFYHTLFRSTKDLTCIIIAHRLSTIKQCSQIVILDKGHVVEQGTHQELISTNGIYQKLFGITKK